MSPRRQRIDKVITHRGKELDLRVSTLVEQRAQEAHAVELAQAERAEAEQASEIRLKLAQETTSAKDWVAANEWHRTRVNRAERAETLVVHARASTENARAEVLNARSDLKRVEILAERLSAEERAQAELKARRLEDELSALRFESARREK
jgi:flagellar export protein FliJ